MFQLKQYTCISTTSTVSLIGLLVTIVTTTSPIVVQSFSPSTTIIIPSHSSSRSHQHRPHRSYITQLPSYLDSLQQQQQRQSQPSPVSPFWSSPSPSRVRVTSPPPPPPPQNPPPATNDATTITTSLFAHAPLSYFSLNQLKPKGPRTSDWGTPSDSTRPLPSPAAAASTSPLRAGSWYCTTGGWPSSSPKAHTEIFYMLSGHGCLTDSDGMAHYFGPGDTVIIPKGHTGRWDVNEAIHKIWAVNDHEWVEDENPRVRVDGYHTLAPHLIREIKTMGDVDPLYGAAMMGDEGVATKTFYDVGPTSVGAWMCDKVGMSLEVTMRGRRAFFHLLEGVVVVSERGTGEARRCVPGDTMVLEEGWCGFVDVIEPVKKIWTVVR